MSFDGHSLAQFALAHVPPARVSLAHVFPAHVPLAHASLAKAHLVRVALTSAVPAGAPAASFRLADILLAVHILAATAWVGGMLYALVVLRPSLAALDPQARLQVHMLTLKRFFLVVWHAMPLMLITGWAMIWAVGWDMGHLPWYVNIMQALALVMAAVFLFAFFGPFRRLRRAIRPGPELLDRIRQLITVNLALGAAVIVVASFGQQW